MALTTEFRETVRARTKRDPAFRAALLTEAIEQLRVGDLDLCQAILRDYFSATET